MSRIAFLLALLAGAAYVVASNGALPATLAVHFAASGQANGYMPGSTYRLAMPGLLLGLPLLTVLGMSSAYRSENPRLNLPNRDYWLAPERRARSVAFLLAHANWFGVLLVGLFCRVHFLVLQANARQPPLLPYDTAMSVLLLFGGGMALWIVILMLRFGRRS